MLLLSLGVDNNENNFYHFLMRLLNEIPFVDLGGVCP